MAKSPFFIFSQMANQSQQQDTSSSFALFSASECIAWQTVFGIEAAAIVTLNALTIIVYLKEHSLRKRSMYLVINLAVADMFVGGRVIYSFLFWGTICDFWTINLFSNLSYFLILAMLNVFPIVSLVNLTAISLERAHATFHPIKYRLIKKKIFGAAVAIVWIIAGLISTSFALIGVFQPLTFELLCIFDISSFSFFLFCLLIIVVSYSRMAKKIIFGTQPHRHGVSSRERKLTKTLLIVTVASLQLTLPLIIFRIREIVESSISTLISPTTFVRIFYSFSFLLYANSLVNPFLYILRMPEFRRALFSFFHCRSHGQTQSAQAFPVNEM